MNEFHNVHIHDNWGHIYFEIFSSNMFIMGMSHHVRIYLRFTNINYKLCKKILKLKFFIQIAYFEEPSLIILLGCDPKHSKFFYHNYIPHVDNAMEFFIIINFFSACVEGG